MIIVVAIVVAAVIFLSAYFNYIYKVNKTIRGTLSISQDGVSLDLISVCVQLWDIISPTGSTTMSSMSIQNVPLLASTQTNFTVISTIDFSVEFKNVIFGWENYFISLGRHGETSLEMRVTYLFAYNQS